ncbi:E3 ubiquitin-protein ligase RNF10 [Anabrus simplex]|uniref:E3 ubiquitin-protein ligase RNF10 n=1 Tax=Anabrus simplex TaxID=316456 RepID=UPI0034DDB195
MLEDFAMEKKSSGRSVPAPAKGNCTELKKNQEIAGGSKPIPRTVRRREPTPFNTPKNDGGRRPTPQKARYGDKRPRPKGQTYGSGKEDTKVGLGAPAEHESVTLSKKQNLNHLLNFHYVRREGGQSAHGSWRQNQAGWGRRLMNTHKHKYNKEQFLQANCQFVVRHASDYMEHLANPDLLVDWGRIEQINFRTAENLSCPICLYPPSAAKMTRCGHIFCWSCILHYLALSDKHCRKCPICFEPVEKVDLKSVVVMKHTQYSVGDEICLRLMKRERGFLLPIPVGDDRHLHNKLLSVSEKELDTTYSKLLLANPKEVLEIIARERMELETRLITEMGCPEQCFTEQALELLKERELPLYKESLVVQPFISGELSPDRQHTPEKGPIKIYQSSWDNEYTSSVLVSTEESSPVSNRESDDIENNFSGIRKLGTTLEDSQRQRFESVSSEGLGSEDAVSSLTIEDLEMTHSASMASSAAPKFYYFYQAADGQHVYLHAVNVRMLEHQYGNLERCPPTVKGRILEKESGSMTEEVRHRLRYLQHLPVTCQFEVVEIQLKPPIISRSTVEYFQDQLEMRKRRRLRRARDERRREKRINDEERRRMGQYPLPSLCLKSHMQFPLCGSEGDCVGIPSPNAAESSSREQDLSTSMSELNLEDSRANFAEDELGDNASGPSFAQMLREGKSRGSGVVAAEDGRTTQSKTPLNVHPSRCSSDGEQDIEGYVPAPDYQQFLSEAITKAMQKAAEVKDSTQGGVSSGKRKKKLKQKILFATGMAFSNK